MALFNFPFGRATNANGATLSGAKLYFYVTETLDAAAVYTTAERDVEHSTPVEADSGGLFPPIYLDPGLVYRAILKTAAGVTIQDIDPYDPAGSSAVLTPQMFGAVGGGITDDYQAFQDAIDAAAYKKLSIPYNENGYYISNTLSIEHTMEIEGEDNYYFCRLIFPAGKTGIRIYHSNDSPNGSDGSKTSIRRIRVDAAAKTTTAHGIHISANSVKLDQVDVYGFKGNGVNNVATAPSGNGNQFLFSGCSSRNNDGDGWYIDGADVNAGVVINCDGSSNGGWGFNDSSFLGNTFVGCHVAANTTGAYRTDDANERSVFIGCYSESGQPASSFSSKTTIVGGLHAAGLAGGAQLLADNNRHYGRLGFSEEISGGVYATMLLGEDASLASLRGLGRGSVATIYWREKIDSNQVVYYDYNNAGGSIPVQMIGAVGITVGGRPTARAYVMRYPNGAYMNNSFHTSGTAAPTTGDWGRGDIVWNETPSAGGAPGWICVTAGTPGTWKAMANVAA